MRKGYLTAVFFAAVTAIGVNVYRPSSRAVPELEDPNTPPSDSILVALRDTSSTDTLNPLSVFSQPPTVQDATAVKKNAVSFDFIFGDSIAEGMRMVSNLPGNTKVGRGPKGIYEALKSYDPAALKGKNIILTMGSGNRPSEFDEYGPKQLQYLKDIGVANVVVMGISNRHPRLDSRTMNEKIKNLAKSFGFIYGGEITNASQKDNVHPPTLNGYRLILSQAQNAYDASVGNAKPVSPAADTLGGKGSSPKDTLRR